MVRNEWVDLLDAFFETWGRFRIRLEEFQKAMLELLGIAKQVNKETAKTSNKYYRPPKNLYLKNEIPVFYKIESRVPKHLPYQRRIY